MVQHDYPLDLLLQLAPDLPGLLHPDFYHLNLLPGLLDPVSVLPQPHLSGFRLVQKQVGVLSQTPESEAVQKMRMPTFEKQSLHIQDKFPMPKLYQLSYFPFQDQVA